MVKCEFWMINRNRAVSPPSTTKCRGPEQQVPATSLLAYGAMETGKFVHSAHAVAGPMQLAMAGITTRAVVNWEF